MRTKLDVDRQPLWCVIGLNLFEGLSAEEMQELSRYTHGRKYKRGEIIYLPGDPSTTVYLLKSGTVKLSYLDQSGRKLTLAICRPGQPFGELSVDPQARHRLIAQALEDSSLCMISRADLLRFAQQRPHLNLRLTKWVSQQREELETKLEDLIFKDVPTRLARLLNRLAQEWGQPDPHGGVQIMLRLTHQDLAELIGSTRETTTLLLNEFQRAGMLVKRRSTLALTNLEALRQRCAY